MGPATWRGVIWRCRRPSPTAPLRAAGEDGGVGADFGGAGAESRNTDISEKVEGPEKILHRPEGDSGDQFKPVL